MALTQISTKGIKDGTITNADLGASAAIAGTKISPDFGSQNITTTGNIDCASDTNKVRLGASQDFTFEHNGTINKILSAGNRLIISGSSADNVDIMHTQSEFMAKFIPNGAVELYHDNSKKFETTSSGVTVSGGTVANGHITLPDHTGSQDGKLRFGASTDLEIYHDGSNSYIKDAGTGSLLIRGSTVSIQSVSGEAMIEGVADGAVTIKHDNSTKFETHSGGVNLLGSGTDAIQMTGDVWFNNNEHAGADIYFNSGEKHLIYEDGVRAKFGGGGDLEIIHDGTNSRITNITNDLRIESDRIELNNQASNEFYLTCTANGAVELYYNNSNKFETNTEGVRVNGYLEMLDDQRIQMGTTDDLQIYHEAGFHSYIRETQNGNLVLWTNPSGTYSTIVLGAGQENSIICNKLGSVELYHISGVGSTSKKFETTSVGAKISGDGEALRIQGVDGDTFMKILGNTNINVILGHLNDQGFVGNSTNHDFFIRTNNQNRISISNSGTLSGDLNDTSDENLKENIVSISDDAISDIKKLRPVNFDWKDSEKAKNQSGFIAQEVKTIFPNLVVGEEYDESKENFGFAINTSGLVAHLTKALQEAIGRIEALEAK